MTVRALVVGAGPAGLSAAMQMNTWCDSVEVVEARGRLDLRHAGEHVPPAGLSSLAKLGLEPLLDDPRHGKSSGVCSTWGDDAPAERDYYFTPVGSGVNLRRDIFDEALAQQAEQRGTKLGFATRLTKLVQTSNGYEATVRGQAGTRTIDCDIVIDASGRSARAARQLGATVDRLDDLVGIVGQIEGCEASDDVGTLHIEAIDNGWWYGVQFTDGRLFCTYMTDASLVSAHSGGARGVWQKGLAATQLLAPPAGTGRWNGKVNVFDAATQVLENPTRADFLAVGDAAAAYDPLSSWGITKALVDGHEGAEALEHEHMGVTGAVAEHREKRRNQFHNYRNQRIRFYSMERRWPQSQFWRMRQAA